MFVLRVEPPTVCRSQRCAAGIVLHQHAVETVGAGLGPIIMLDGIAFLERPDGAGGACRNYIGTFNVGLRSYDRIEIDIPYLQDIAFGGKRGRVEQCLRLRTF